MDKVYSINQIDKRVSNFPSWFYFSIQEYAVMVWSLDTPKITLWDTRISPGAN